MCSSDLVVFISSDNKIFFDSQQIYYINIGDVLTFSGTIYNNTSYTVVEIIRSIIGTNIIVSETITNYEIVDYLTLTINRGAGIGYYYPLIDYGNVSTDKHNYSYLAFRPAFYVREIMDKIITNAGYTYSSNFFNSDFFNSLIIPNNQKVLNTYKTESLSIKKHCVECSNDDLGFFEGNERTIYNDDFYTGLFTPVDVNADNKSYKWTGQTTWFRLTCNNTMSFLHLNQGQNVEFYIKFYINDVFVYQSTRMQTQSRTSYYLDYQVNESFVEKIGRAHV